MKTIIATWAGTTIVAGCILFALFYLTRCDSFNPLNRDYGKHDLVFRCETFVEESDSKKIVRYKPIEVIHGEIKDAFLDKNGLLKYICKTDADVSIGKHYKFVIRRSEGKPSEDFPLGSYHSFTLESLD